MDQATSTTGIAAERTISDRSAERLFSWAIVVSGIRCLIAYILLPFVLPFLGLSEAVGPWLGVGIGVVAIVANVFSIRRFSRSSHRLRKPVIAINITVIALLTVLMVIDLQAALAA